MERRNFFSFVTVLAASLGLRPQGKALPALPKLILLVRPQDEFEWILRTSCTLTYVQGSSPKEVNSVLRVNRSTRRLYMTSGKLDLPRIDRIEADPALVSAPESAWRVVERAS